MKTWEVYKIALENPKAKFKRLSHNDICHVDALGQLKIADTNGQYPLTKVDEDWELVRESVDFMTAINSGKSIQPVGHSMWGDANVWLRQKAMRLEWINGKWLIE